MREECIETIRAESDAELSIVNIAVHKHNSNDGKTALIGIDIVFLVLLHIHGTIGTKHFYMIPLSKKKTYLGYRNVETENGCMCLGKSTIIVCILWTGKHYFMLSYGISKKTTLHLTLLLFLYLAVGFLIN